jgi:FkbM family methyltransferase
MKKQINRFFTFFGIKISRVSKNIDIPSIQSIRVIPWFELNGDKTLRLDYSLNDESLVFDLGGYEGEWSADIFCKYGSNIYVFEPNKDFYNNIVQKFCKNDKIKLFNFGLAGNDRMEKLYLNENSSSLFSHGENFTEIQLKSVVEFMETEKIENIDLIKINIEGGEFEFFEKILSSNLALKFDNIQVQFHDFVPDSDSRMKQIQNELSKTHFLTYQFEYVWENWKRK